MTICEKMDLDFVRTGIRQKAYAVQGDSYARTLEIAMHENGVAWNMPVGASAFLRYRKPDGTGGMYDTLPDGTQAWSAQGNRVHFILAPQVLSVPGIVRAQMEVISGKSSVATFSFLIEVEEDPSNGVILSEDYTRWNAWAMQALENLFLVSDSQPDAVPALWFDTTPGTGTQMTVLDRQGYSTLVYPITKPECVEGLPDALAGKAPAGYGIGKLENYDVNTDNDIDSVLTSQIIGMDGQTFKRIVLSLKETTNFTGGGGHYYADIYKLSTNFAMITIKSYIQGGRTMQRTWFEGALTPWEWNNPPMTPGVEYRTTKRHNGKPVYTKLVEFGALPNNAEKSVSAMPANASLIQAAGYAAGASYNVPIPGYYAIKSFGSTRSSGALWISTSADMSSYNAWITIEYTKD